MQTTSRKYRQAAVAYLIYGLIYLAGAIYLGQVGKGPPGGPLWYVIGALMALGFPVLIWFEFKWVTRALAILVFIRVIGLLRIGLRTERENVPLPWGGEISLQLGAFVFLLVAAVACFLLARAGWQRGVRSQSQASPSSEAPPPA